MGKEAKLGVALIAVLVGAFGLVLYKRIKEASPPTEPAAAANAEAESKPAAGSSEKPKLSSGPLKPTVVQSAPAGNAPQTLVSSSTATPGESTSRYGNYPSQPPATATDDHRTTKDPFASAGSTANSRYDRYSSSDKQIYGAESSAEPESAATATNEGASTASTAATTGQADPFSRYGSRATGSALTPTGDASAALLPTSATAEATPTPTEDRSEVAEPVATDASPEVDHNPLRSATADPSTTTSSRSSAPRGYDLYGDASSSTDATVRTPAASEATSSRVRFGQSSMGVDRYTSEPANNTNRYNPSTVADVPANPPRTRTDSGSGWSGAGSTVSTGPSATTSVTAPPKSTATPIAPAAQSRPRTVPASVQRSDTYVVQPNDSFSTISEKLYGTSSYFKALQEHNKAKHPRPDRLRTGDVVATPSVETLLQKYPSLCPRPSHLPLPGRSSSLASQRGGRVYVVEEGDTLFDIARFELGKATRWAEIYELNKEVIGEDFNHLRPGTQLALPAEMHDDTFTRRPSNSVPR